MTESSRQTTTPQEEGSFADSDSSFASPNKVQEFMSKREKIMIGYNQISIDEISIWKILTNKEAVMAHISSSISNYNISFFNSFLCLQLEQYGITQKNMGFCFMLLSMPYFFATLSTPIICRKVPRKLQFVICFGISTVSFSLMGPSRLLDFPHSVTMVLIGMTMLGFIQALCFIQSLPEAIEVFQ